MTHKIALVTHDLSGGGGVGSMTAFLYRVLVDSAKYEPEIISLAMSASDKDSIRLCSPKSWFTGIQVRKAKWRHLNYLHVGACATEFEPQRYKPRAELTRLLNKYDLIQFVVGNSPYVCVGVDSPRPQLLWAATTIRAERNCQLQSGPMLRRLWSFLMVPLTERYERRGLRQVDTVFALSNYTKDLLQSVTGKKRVLLAPCGVDTDMFRPVSNPTADYILAVARFSDPRKNVRLLMEAYAQVCNLDPATPPLFLVGDLPSAETQLHLGRLHITEKVHLIGPKEGKELADLYRNAMFFVLSSDEEGLAIVILEAMASGLAVVSTDCGGPATSIINGRTGFLTPTGQVALLAQRMRELIQNKALREQMGRSARELAEKRFSLNATGNMFLSKYDELLGHKLQAKGFVSAATIVAAEQQSSTA